MRTPWWAILVTALVACGCGREAVPDYDSEQSQLLVSTLAEIRAGDPARSLAALEALGAADPNSRLPELALAHERDRELVARLNRHLQSGELGQAGEILRHQRRFGDMGTSLMAWSELPDALRAMERYVAGKPYQTSVQMRQALARLDEWQRLLAESPAFQTFRNAEYEALSGLVNQEKDRIAQSLLSDLDALVLVGDDQAGQVLAQIVSTVGLGHPLPATVDAVARGDWRKVRELSEMGDSGLYRSEYLEIAFAMFWDELPSEVRRALGRGLVRLSPCTLSGLLLHSRYAAQYGRMDDAVIYLRELSSSVQMTPSLVGRVLESMVLPRTAFGADCWQRPVPGVIDLLGRLDQLRDHVRDPER